MNLVVIGATLVLGIFVIVGRMAAGSFEPEEEEDGITVEVAMGDDSARAGQQGKLVGIAGGGEGLQGGSGEGGGSNHSLGGEGQGGNNGVIEGGGVMVGGAQSPVEGKDREHNLTQTTTCAHCGAANTSSSSRCWSCGSSPGATIKADTVKIVNETNTQSDAAERDDDSRQVASEDVRDPDDYGFDTDKDANGNDEPEPSQPAAGTTEDSPTNDRSGSGQESATGAVETDFPGDPASEPNEIGNDAISSNVTPTDIAADGSPPTQEPQISTDSPSEYDIDGDEPSSTKGISDRPTASINQTTKTLLLSGLIIVVGVAGLIVGGLETGISTVSDGIVSIGIAVLAGSIGTILIDYNDLKNILIGYPLLMTGISAPVLLLLAGTPVTEFALSLTRSISLAFMPLFSLVGLDAILTGGLDTPQQSFVLMCFIVGVLIGIPTGVGQYLLEPVETNNVGRNNEGENSTYYNYE